MLHLVLILSIAVFAAGPQFKCSGKPNGLYIREDCTRDFIYCQDGKEFVQSCPRDWVFDRRLLMCMDPEECRKSFAGKYWKEEDEAGTYRLPSIYDGINHDNIYMMAQ